MPNLNKIEIIGHVGQEPEMRFTPNGVPVTTFSVAVNREYKDSQGNKQKDTEWFTVVCWRKLAESTNQFVSKGMLIYVSGGLHLKRWENQQNEQRSRNEITATGVLFLNRPNATEQTETEQIEYLDIPF